MLNLWGNKVRTDCSGVGRRDFLKIGTLGATGLMLPDLLRLRSQASAQTGQPTRNTSVVWLWLGGGPTHVETFDPKMSAPAEFRSMVGDVQTNVPGLRIGGLFPQMGRMADKMAFVRSFAHGNSGHAGGTHFVMTGVDHPPADAGQPQIRPSMGSITARVRGANSASGLPTYVRLSGLYGDGPHWLGSAYAPFDTSGQARSNINLSQPLDRVNDRRSLLRQFDTVNRNIERSGVMAGLDAFDQQANDLLLGRAREAFEVGREDPRVRDRYTSGTAGLGANLLLARRLCEAGAGFVTLNYSNSSQGWDMHNDMLPQLRQACPPLDRAIAVFLEDLERRGLSDQILLVITGEFGRTPRINGSAGRDHWGPLCTLALAGGGLRMGQAIGESSERVEVPRTAPIYPRDLMATIFHVLGINAQAQLQHPSGRPTYLLPEGARAIAELV